MNDEFLKALSKDGLTVKDAHSEAEVKGWVTTGNYALNWAVSGRFSRGYPLGRIVEWFGDPSTGKSYLVAAAMREFQKIGAVTGLDDTEGAFNNAWAARLGVDPTKVKPYEKSNTIEEHFNWVNTVVERARQLKGGAPTIGIFNDSWANLSTAHERKVGLDKPDMSKAKLGKGFFRILAGTISTLPVCYVATNHTIATQDMFNPVDTPGGGGLKFMSSIRGHLLKPAKLKREGTSELVGVRIQVGVVKTRFTEGFKKCSIVIPFSRPISPYSGLIPVLIDIGVIEVVGIKIAYNGVTTKINAALSDSMKQDIAAEMLVKTHPDILKHADELIAEKEKSLVYVPEMSATAEEDE
jgi:RecA/RadA recombinase